MRMLALAAVLAAAALPASPVAASCSLGQLGTNPWTCGPTPTDADRDRPSVVPCRVQSGQVTAAAFVPYATGVEITCTGGSASVSEYREGPVGYVEPRPMAYAGGLCTTVVWSYADYTYGSATYGC